MDNSGQTPSPFGEHQLAAIVFTDVVDYSAQMARDADATLRAVESDFRRLRQLCARYGGTVRNTMGDGMLMSFTSATQAVVCALRVQQEFAARSRAHPDALRHRIGIHMGDIILGPEGVAGDGVNIAARILTLAAPGGACLSEAVHRAVKSQVKLKVESLGTPALKNIVEPVPVCRVDIQESQLPMRARIALSAQRPAWRLGAAAVMLLVLVLVVGAGWWLLRPRTQPAASVATNAPAPAPAARISDKSIAVIPFVDLSGTRDQDYFSDGVTEELTNALTRLPDVRVAARTSAAAYRGKTVAVTEIGRELKVAKLLEGSVRKIGTRIRVSVRLSNTADGFQLWSATFEREAKDALTVQVELARTIAQQLQPFLGDGSRGNVERLATDNPDAYNLYQRGRQILNRGSSDTSEAQRLFEGAIAADEYYSAAYAGVADCHILRVFHGRVAPGEAMPLALAAAERARELDPQSADAYAAIGFVRLFYDWDTRAAEEMLQRALERNPNHLGALCWRAVARLNRADPDAAKSMTTHAIESAPESPMAHLVRGWALLLAGDFARARPELEKSLALDPTAALTHALLGQEAEVAGDNAAALVRYEAGLAKVTNNTLLLAHFIRAKGLLGRGEEARAALRDLTERGRRGYVRAYLLAVAHSGLGETELALDALERAVAEHDPAIATLRLNAMFDSLRSQPRFQKLESDVEAKLWSNRLRR